MFGKSLHLSRAKHFYPQNIFLKSVYLSSPKLWPIGSFVDLLGLVSHLELDIDQKLISSFLCMRDFSWS